MGALKRPNLCVRTYARVSRVVLEGRRARGVAYRIGNTDAELADATELVVKARREVLLSAGAVQSPQLLLLSGIGAPEHLAKHGVPLAVPLPGVGRHLKDHLMVPQLFSAREDDRLCLLGGKPTGWQVRLILKLAWRFLTKGDGLFAGPVVTNMAFMRTGLRAEDDPQAQEVDLQFQLCCVGGGDPGGDAGLHGKSNWIPKYGKLWEMENQEKIRGLTFFPTLLLPKSEGFVELTSADPLAPPHIQPNYLSDPYDVEVLVRGMRLCREMCGTPALAEVIAGEAPEPDIAHAPESDAYLAEYVRRNASTVYHPMGTCRMGPASNPDAVVDPYCRVHGVEALRVVDASVMPTAMTGNTNAPTIMIAEKIASAIRGK